MRASVLCEGLFFPLTILNKLCFHELCDKLKQVMKTSLTNFYQKKSIICGYSKSSNSLGFNSIWQKLCKMICEIIFCKTVSEIFLIFCRLHFINNFVMKISFNRKINKVKYLVIHLCLKFFRTSF